MMKDNGLNKLAEECAELTQVAMKLAHYPDNDHPDGTNLVDRLHQEIGDVLGIIRYVIDKHDLNTNVIYQRNSEKLSLYQQWENED